MAPRRLGCCRCPISMTIFQSGSSSISQRKGDNREDGDGKYKDEENTNKDNGVHVVHTDPETYPDPAISTSTSATGMNISPTTSGNPSDSQLSNLHEINADTNHITASMPSDADADVDIDAQSNSYNDDKEKQKMTSDVSEKKGMNVPPDADADADADADDITGADVETKVNADNETNICRVEEEENPTQLTSGVSKKRRVSFLTGFAKAIYDIPNRNEYDETNIKDDLFYGDADYDRFRASEQRRYEKLVAKKLQKMVMEKMQPSINEAVVNGATLEDIEAMVPKTHAEMVAYMGGEENIRRLVEESSFSKLSSKEEKQELIRSSGSSMGKSTTTTTTTPRNSNNGSDNETKNDTEHSNENENMGKEVENVRATTRKRTIRSSRSSIHIPSRNTDVGGREASLSNAEADAVTASEEFMAMIAEGEDQKEAM